MLEIWCELKASNPEVWDEPPCCTSDARDPRVFPLCFFVSLQCVHIAAQDGLGYSVHAVLELAVLLLSQPSKSWDQRHEPLYSSVLCLIDCLRFKQVFYHWAAALDPLHLYFEINFVELPWPAFNLFCTLKQGLKIDLKPIILYSFCPSYAGIARIHKS